MTTDSLSASAQAPSTVASANDTNVHPVQAQSEVALLESAVSQHWASRLHDIAISKLKLPSSRADAVVRLLQPSYLQSLPVPKGTRQWPTQIRNNNYRHHFYRQLAKILGFRQRHTFPEQLTALLHEVWPDEAIQQQQQKRNGEEEGEPERKLCKISLHTHFPKCHSRELLQLSQGPKTYLCRSCYCRSSREVRNDGAGGCR